MFLAAVILGPRTFTWSAFLVFILDAGRHALAGHSGGFHRRLIHRSFACPKGLERTADWLGTAGRHGGADLDDRRRQSRLGRSRDGLPLVMRHGQTVLIDGFYYLNLPKLMKQPPGFDPGVRHRRTITSMCPQRTWDGALRFQSRWCFISSEAGQWVVCWRLRVRTRRRVTLMHTGNMSYFAHNQGPQDWDRR